VPLAATDQPVTPDLLAIQDPMDLSDCLESLVLPAILDQQAAPDCSEPAVKRVQLERVEVLELVDWLVLPEPSVRRARGGWMETPAVVETRETRGLLGGAASPAALGQPESEACRDIPDQAVRLDSPESWDFQETPAIPV